MAEKEINGESVASSGADISKSKYADGICSPIQFPYPPLAKSRFEVFCMWQSVEMGLLDM